MGSVVMWFAGALAVSSAGLRLYRARRYPTAGVVYLCAAVAAVGCSAVLAAPLTVELLMPVEPFDNFTRWLANGLAMVAAWSVHALLLHLVYAPEHARPSVRRQVVVLAGALAAMSGLLLGAGIPSAPDFVAAAGHRWQITVYVTVFCGYVAYSLANFIRLMAYYARLSTRPWLRRGLGVVRAGAAVGIGWAVLKVLAAMTVLAGGSGGWETLASAILSATCVSLVGIGVTMPAWGPVIAAPVRWVRHYRTHRALRPLWSVLHTAFPEIARTHPGQSTAIAWRLARRVVEIEDGLLLLAPYRTPQERTSPRTGDPEAVWEAVEIRDALHDVARGRTPPVAEPPVPAPQREAGDLDAEAAWLRRVARAYCRVPAIAHRTEEQEFRDQR
ncbi:hypothetical protein IQ251_12630 [Saccharopolyspora sp. HNM0983]|uniref:DUF6545 domain-containing protein n=1 Tax=Saccharopolyspora montiporae TaxID=2781240 RepID=A0A929G067_9PSEU|nr:MAB_1171c family putative transporter [Saccharopolyspora sp. HNM0983]MBE9375290.1 hypothetical protein [Saccharopolyspora sp. HNM0983]